MINALQPSSTEIAIFSGGCFWCVEHAFNDLPGVISVVSGYTGGHVKNPSYGQVCAENTGHKEAVQITFDPAQITYEQLLEKYWYSIDPYNAEGQFCDIGDSYKAVIFYTTSTQKIQAEASKEAVEELQGKAVIVEIQAATIFYPAEEYHQQYAKKNPLRYEHYRSRSGRDERLTEVWGKKK